MTRKSFKKRTKKQPSKSSLVRYREKTKQLEKEIEEIAELKKQTHLLNASLAYDKEVAKKAADEAIAREQTAKNYEKHFRRELERANKYHPALGQNLYIKTDKVEELTIHDILQYRLAAPTLHWDDTQQMGFVKMKFGKVNGSTDEVAFAFSEQALRQVNNLFGEVAAKSLGHEIAEGLLRMVGKKIEDN